MEVASLSLGCVMSQQQTLAEYGDSTSQPDAVDPERYKNPDWLREQYTENRRTTVDIAEELSVSTSTIQRWLETHGIEIRSSSESRLPEHAVDLLQDKEWLREHYVQKRRSMGDIADDLSVSTNAVSGWLKEHGIEIRSPSESRLSERALEQLKDEEWLREQYVEDRRSAHSIADDIGVTSATVYNWLDHHGIETRSNWAAQLSEDAVEQHKKLHGEDWLRTQYVENRRSMDDIADELDVDSSTVESWLDRYGVLTRSYSEARLSEQAVERLQDETWLREQYIEKRRSLPDIADEIGITPKGLFNWLDRHGIETRSISESKLPSNAVERLHSEDWMREQYVEDQRTAVEISEDLNIGATTVYTWLERHGIGVRSGFQDPTHLDHIVRSTWELQVANLLNDYEIEYEYEGIEINWVDDRIYTPDFVTEDYVIEVKGRLYESNEREKARAAMSELDNCEYVVVGTELPSDIHIPWEDRDSLVELFSSP